MFDTQRLGALLRMWMREDALISRLRTAPATPVRPTAPLGPELPPQAHGPAAAPAEDEASTQGAALHLSRTGRVLLAILRDDDARAPAQSAGNVRTRPAGTQSPSAAPVPPKAAATRPQPLTSLPPQSPEETGRLARKLADTVEFSGLFYESHLAQWADGSRPRALLAREPQAQWPATADPALRDPAHDALPASHAVPLLREQFDLLDTGRILWRGELWPGQAGALVIEQEQEDAAPRRPRAPGATAPRWRARITLTFPELGAIDATVGVGGGMVDFALLCSQPDVASRLRADAHALRAAIADRKLDFASLVVVDESGG